MTRALNAAAWLIMLAIVAGVGGLAWLVYRLAENTVQTIDRTWGPAFYQIAAGASLLAFVLVVVGGAVVLVQWMARKSRQIGARDGLYPRIDGGHGQYADLNEPGAQSLAVMAAAGRRPTAALAGRVIDAHYRQPDAPAPPVLPALPEQLGYYPTRVDVYSAPLPRDLALPVGVGGNGSPVALPLRNLGNVLVGGLPGGGKSELLASMMAGLLRQDASGRTVQVAAVDTKLVSFGLLPNLAALYAPPALTLEDAHGLVSSLAGEVQRRFELLHAARVRSLEELEHTTGERLPYLVAFVDELADLSTDPDKARRDRFLALAQEIGRKGRAAGVSLVMATQRPSADVIPSSLRNLAGAAVAFRLARADDSRLVLDAAGAEMLPATPGRCLVRHRDTTQAQAYFAGLEGGRFDQFCAALPAPGWPVRETGIPAQPSPQPGIPVGIPVFGTEQTGDYTLEQVAHIRQRHAALGSLKAVQREIYGQEGGYWFYRIRAAVEAGR